MRITTSQLRRIIKEEARRVVLNEAFEGDSRSDLVNALRGFEKNYLALEGMLKELKRKQEASTEVIQTVQEACKYSSGAVTSMEVFKTWEW